MPQQRIDRADAAEGEVLSRRSELRVSTSLLRQILALPEEVVITGAAYQVSLLDNGFGAFLEEVENDVVILQLEGPASIVPAERVTGATRQVDVAGETFYRTDLEAVE